MTCFWDAIRTQLNLNLNNENLIIYLKNNNHKNHNIVWNGTELTNKQMEENYIHIKDFNEKSIYNGYDCSICDPFLIIICNLYNISIIHNYNGYTIYYSNNLSTRTVNFQSDRGHFW